MSGFKLSNIVLHVDMHAANHPEIYYRVISGEAVYSESSSALRIKGDVDFLTYVNACSVCKWRQYAQIDNLKLSLTLKGSGRVVLRGVPLDSNEPKILSYHSFDFEDISELSVPVEVDKFDLVGFSIISEGLRLLMSLRVLSRPALMLRLSMTFALPFALLHSKMRSTSSPTFPWLKTALLLRVLRLPIIFTCLSSTMGVRSTLTLFLMMS